MGNRTAIIAAAGQATRFSRSVGNECYKILYQEDGEPCLLDMQLEYLRRLGFDSVYIVGGYHFDELQKFLRGYDQTNLEVFLIYNEHFADYGTCYSLYLGINALPSSCNEVVFLEGDLFFDFNALSQIMNSTSSVITYSRDLIDATKSVVFYQDAVGTIRYVYDSAHTSFKVPGEIVKIANSGQVWKFSQVSLLRNIINKYSEINFIGTNLQIVEDYFGDYQGSLDFVAFDCWYNCNIIADYREIVSYWRNLYGTDK